MRVSEVHLSNESGINWESEDLQSAFDGFNSKQRNIEKETLILVIQTGDFPMRSTVR
jgi:hypothetical protein